ncbi:unnamed protein product [Spirodela intermedia]|uniref:Uncharacterized protein n=1 Tax=Spirodela intermedia TaxID=51605 RepID=A0A7I8KM62_SPIIN|nr:unnamed protein product [Spirodela intermedia]
MTDAKSLEAFQLVLIDGCSKADKVRDRLSAMDKKVYGEVFHFSSLSLSVARLLFSPNGRLLVCSPFLSLPISVPCVWTLVGKGNVIREEAARGLNPAVIVLVVFVGLLLVFFVGNYVLYVYAQKNLPQKKKKPVSKKKMRKERLKQGVSAPGE